MVLVKHRFLQHYPLIGKKILILGTFNPDLASNKAEFFYGRSKNYFWTLLPAMFSTPSLKAQSVQDKLSFLQKYEIELSDLILSVNMQKSDLTQYADEKLSNVEQWNTDNIIKTLKKGTTKEVYFTRKTFANVTNIQEQIKKIEAFCIENDLRFRYLPTPSRFVNEHKIQEWKECFFGGK